jgi:hypothetical protein
MTYTYAILEVSERAYQEIRKALEKADYRHCFHEEDGRVVIDMHGIALAKKIRQGPKIQKEKRGTK